MSRRLVLGGLLGAALAGPALLATDAFALDLDQAKAQGLIGERQDGYVGQVSGGGDVAALVNQVNIERRAAYESVATQNGIPISQVERLAAGKLIERAPAGTFVMDASGRWFRK
jgi:hypothetical protein